MSHVRVIGIGSPFGSDQLGWQVVDYLERARSDKDLSDVELYRCDRPGAGLLSMLDGIDHAVLIDAISSSTQNDEVCRLDKNELLSNSTMLSSHDFGVAETIKLGEKLGLLPKKLILYGYEAEPDFEFSRHQIRKLTDIVIHEVLRLQ